MEKFIAFFLIALTATTIVSAMIIQKTPAAPTPIAKTGIKKPPLTIQQLKVKRQQLLNRLGVIKKCIAADKVRIAADKIKLSKGDTSAGDDAQKANVDLQDKLQKQQQTLQLMSAISKQLHDTAMTNVRNIGG